MRDKYRSQSLYWYPGTEVLKNNFNLKEQQKLDNLEITYTTRRLAQLYNDPITGLFGLTHLQKIHNYIFQDVYPFAGELRKEQIEKGATKFAHPMYIESYGNSVLKELKGGKSLQGLDKEKFSKQSSFYFSEINILHPFREGNGRTQREFFRVLALMNGYELNWSNIDATSMMKASIKSVTDSYAFKEIFDIAIVNKQPDQNLIKEYKSLKLKANELEL
ncbi:Fic family protein [Virgibacillus sp. Bac332]|uniref:Fic/DOC family protein n=1 Tax=Virgibacillus sp. Bac332 TaxID=2419842 RepID=UPI000EF4E30D|nr:Fic family protein [Virgibacillus sp. Bac332]